MGNVQLDHLVKQYTHVHLPAQEVGVLNFRENRGPKPGHMSQEQTGSGRGERVPHNSDKLILRFFDMHIFRMRYGNNSREIVVYSLKVPEGVTTLSGGGILTP